VSFALACFFSFMALLTAAAPVTHLGGWLIKVLLYTLFLGLTLLISNADMVRYAEAARVFSVLFLLSQVVIIVNLVYTVHEALVQRMNALEERLARMTPPQHSGLLGNCWSNTYVLLCLGFVLSALTGCGLMYQYFGNSCPLNNFFISQTLIVGVTLCVLSLVFPGTFGRGLLPPAIIMAYNTYLTFSAITNNPDPVCNPTAATSNQSQASIVVGLVLAIVSVTWTALSSAGSIYSAVTTTGGGAGAGGEEEEGERAQRNPAAQAAQTYQGGGSGKVSASTTRGSSSRGGGEDDGEEEEGGRGAGARGSSSGSSAAASAAAAGAAAPAAESRWKPFAFHFELFLAGCYVAMMASNWGDPSQQNNPNNRNTPELSSASMWARMGSQFAIHVLFIWTLIAPVVRWACVCVCVCPAPPQTTPASFAAVLTPHPHTCTCPARCAPGVTFRAPRPAFGVLLSVSLSLPLVSSKCPLFFFPALHCVFPACCPLDREIAG
jgi:hypothetical protein